MGTYMTVILSFSDEENAGKVSPIVKINKFMRKRWLRIFEPDFPNKLYEIYDITPENIFICQVKDFWIQEFTEAIKDCAWWNPKAVQVFVKSDSDGAKFRIYEPFVHHKICEICGQIIPIDLLDKEAFLICHNYWHHDD